MPRINKVRLVNFRWSTQRIDDLLLDFHSGQNTELRLENGGGKSVLERLIYQSVWPGTKVSDNPVIDYIGDKPATVAVEWLLDTARNEEPDYLTSGVVLSRNTGPEEDKATVNYLMFTSHNDHLNVHELPHISSSIDGKRITIQSFRETRDALNSLERKYPEIRVYARKEAKAYRQTLKSFGISPENWNQLILQLISGEDPFKDVLGRTKTSDSLLNLYIIPKIDSHLDQISSDAIKIRNNMDHVVSDSASQSDFIHLRDAIGEYLEWMPQTTDHLSGILETVEQRDRDLMNLSSFAWSVHLLEQECADRLQAIEQEENELDQEEKQIQLEKASADWYQKKKEQEEADLNEKEGNEKWQASSEKCREITLQLNILMAAKSYQRIQELDAQIREYQIRLNGISDNEESRHVASLGYSIRLAYEQEMLDCQKIRKDLEQQEKKNQETIRKIRDQISAQIEEGRKARTELSSLTSQIQIMDSHFDNLWKELDAGFIPGRGFSGNLIQEDLNQVRKVLEDRIQKVTDAIAADQKREEKIQKRIPACQKEHDQTTDQIYETKGKINETETLKNQYLSNLDILKDIFRRNEMDEKYLFHKERDGMIDNQMVNTSSAVSTITYEIRVLSHLIEAVRNGETYLPSEFGEFLTRHHISYQSGEEFLRHTDDPDSYVKKLPLLPYGIILDPSEYTKLKNIEDPDFFLDRMIPVFLYEDLDTQEKHEYEGSVLKTADQKYFLHIEKNLLHAKTKEAFIQNKEEEKETKNTRLQSLNAKMEDLRKAKELLSDFPASATALSEFEKDLEDLRQQKENLQKKQKELQKELQDLNEEQKETAVHLRACQENLSAQKEQKQNFEKAVKEDETYVHTKNQYVQVTEILKKTERKQDQLQEEKDKTDSDLSEVRQKIIEASLRLEDLKKKYSRFQNMEKAELIPGNLNSLLEAYEIASSRLNSDQQVLQKHLNNCQDQKNNESQSLQSLGLEERQYQDVTYNAQEYDRLNHLEKNEEKEEKNLHRIFTELSQKKGKADYAFEQARNALIQYGVDQPLPPEKIGGNFAARSQKVKEQLTSLREEQKNTEKKQNTAQRVYDAVTDSDLNLPETTDIVELEENLNAQRNLLLEHYRKNQSVLKDQISQYRSECQEVQKKFIQKDEYFKNVFRNEKFLEVDAITVEIIRNRIAMEEEISGTLHKRYDQLNADLKTYDDAETELFREVETRTRAVYDALQEVSDCSRVRVEGKATPRKLLRIDLPQTDENASVRLRQYLTLAISELAEAKKENDEKKYQSMLSAKMDSRKLLDIWINQTKIPVKVYKFEKITENSRLMEWDKACRSNSGGEHSLSCFIVIAALMAYIRNDHQEFEDESGIRKSETIICDNPFASVSSEHLVRPLIDIVKALNIQLITFTHINSASIANFFDVVIQLRNIRNTGNSTRLSVADESVSSEVNDMESASLYRESVQQSLF